MFLILGISLFTSRVILQVLGIQDYGIYNVVGGIIAMSGIFNSAMSSSVTRYLTFELGKGDSLQLKKTFSTSLSIYFILCVLFLILAETIGLWFLNNKLIIPADRIIAANYIYQFTILSTIATLIANPYNASIISHEKMSVYAYVSIIEVILKLIIVYILYIIPIDHLISYGALILLTNIIITIAYIIYCLKKFPECHFKFYNDKKLFKQMFSYSGWNLFGAAAGLVKGQGLNILLNMFFDPIVNAARGIAYQINTAIVQFSGNFYTAVKPQITKYYAQTKLDEMLKLIFQRSKMSCYLILLLSLPIAIENPLYSFVMARTNSRLCSHIRPLHYSNLSGRSNGKSINDSSSCHRQNCIIPITGWHYNNAKHPYFIYFFNLQFSSRYCFHYFSDNRNIVSFYPPMDCQKAYQPTILEIF